ncbi:hypothetical protein [Amycolatopsis sp. NPDC051061]|uniref:hypothetical protein n=1 Tax=Amycolatopsis sp. NPDC051061 TaxID=3155042 RepID=UPI003443B8EC
MTDPDYHQWSLARACSDNKKRLGADSRFFVVLFFAYLEIVYMDMQARVMRRCTEIGALFNSSMLNSLTTLDEGYTFGIKAAFGPEPFRWSTVRHILSSRPELYVLHRVGSDHVHLDFVDMAAEVAVTLHCVDPPATPLWGERV